MKKLSAVLSMVLLMVSLSAAATGLFMDQNQNIDVNGNNITNCGFINGVDCTNLGGGIQTLTQSNGNVNDTISISSGNTVTIFDNLGIDTNASTACTGTDTYLSGDGTCETDTSGSGSDFDNQTLSIQNEWSGTNDNLSITNGNSVLISDNFSKNAVDEGCTSTQYLNGNGNCQTDDSGSDNQQLSIDNSSVNHTISLGNGGSVVAWDRFQPDTDTQDLSIDNSSVNETISLVDGGSVTLWDHFQPDTDTQNPNQTLSVVNDSTSTHELLTITGGNSVLLDDDFEADTQNPNQTLSVNSGSTDDQISISSGNTVTIDDDTGTDSQTLSVNNDSTDRHDLVSISGGNQVLVDDYYETDTTNPNQTLSIDSTSINDTITLSNGGSVTLFDDYEPDTDTTYSAGTGLSLTGTTFNLTDNSLTVAGNNVVLGGSTAVDHSDLSNINSDDHHAKYTDEEAEDTVGAMTVGGTDVSVNYIDSNPSLFVNLTGLTQFSTSDLSEGSNLYYTDERAQDSVGAMTDNTLTYTDSTPELSVATGNLDHGSLAGLGADDHDDYLDKDGAEAMTGSLDMGNNDVNNIGDADIDMVYDSGQTRFELRSNGNEAICIGNC